MLSLSLQWLRSIEKVNAKTYLMMAIIIRHHKRRPIHPRWTRESERSWTRDKERNCGKWSVSIATSWFPMHRAMATEIRTNWSIHSPWSTSSPNWGRVLLNRSRDSGHSMPGSRRNLLSAILGVCILTVRPNLSVTEMGCPLPSDCQIQKDWDKKRAFDPSISCAFISICDVPLFPMWISIFLLWISVFRETVFGHIVCTVYITYYVIPSSSFHPLFEQYVSRFFRRGHLLLFS